MGLSQAELEDLADLAAAELQIPAEGWRALIARESGWDPNAVSGAGAFGLTQLMPETAGEVCGWLGWDLDQVDPWDPATQLILGATYLRWLYDRTGSWPRTLAAYNGGIGRVERAVRDHGDAWLDRMPAETRAYVAALAPSFPPDESAGGSWLGPIALAASLALAARLLG